MRPTAGSARSPAKSPLAPARTFESSAHRGADILRTVKGARTSLRLRIVPGARRSGIVGRHADGWKVRVAATPEAGRANEVLLRLLARTLDLPRRDLELTRGRTSRDKIVTLEGLTGEVADEKLAAAAEHDR